MGEVLARKEETSGEGTLTKGGRLGMLSQVTLANP
jgi:hypothetical protein